MHRLSLDESTADRLAAGELDPHDAPPGYALVAELLVDAHRRPAITEIAPSLLGSMVHAVSADPPDVRTRSMLSKFFTAKAAAGAAVLVLATTGVAAASTGNLPDPAQDAVAAAASHVGFDLPRSGGHDAADADDADEFDEVGDDVTAPDDADDQADDTDGDTDAKTGADGAKASRRSDHPDNHGAEVSDTARTTPSTGRDKGAEVSNTARAGHGDQGEDHSDGHEGDDDADDQPGASGKATASERSAQRSDAGSNRGSDRSGRSDHRGDDDHAGSTTTPVGTP